jgi:hypothetical protein
MVRVILDEIEPEPCGQRVQSTEWVIWVAMDRLGIGVLQLTGQGTLVVVPYVQKGQWRVLVFSCAMDQPPHCSHEQQVFWLLPEKLHRLASWKVISDW